MCLIKTKVLLAIVDIVGVGLAVAVVSVEAAQHVIRISLMKLGREMLSDYLWICLLLAETGVATSHYHAFGILLHLILIINCREVISD